MSEILMPIISIMAIMYSVVGLAVMIHSHPADSHIEDFLRILICGPFCWVLLFPILLLAVLLDLINRD